MFTLDVEVGKVPDAKCRHITANLTVLGREAGRIGDSVAPLSKNKLLKLDEICDARNGQTSLVHKTKIQPKAVRLQQFGC